MIEREALCNSTIMPYSINAILKNYPYLYSIIIEMRKICLYNVMQCVLLLSQLLSPILMNEKWKPGQWRKPSEMPWYSGISVSPDDSIIILEMALFWGRGEGSAVSLMSILLSQSLMIIWGGNSMIIICNDLVMMCLIYSLGGWGKPTREK